MKTIKWIFGGSYRFYRDLTGEYEPMMGYMLQKDVIHIEDVEEMLEKIHVFEKEFHWRILREVPKLFSHYPSNTYYEAITSLKKAYNHYLDMV